MAEPFLTIDDLTEHLENLPDWYVQVLEDRERNACDVCPEDEIEIELTDFSGRPISGEPWFVFMENTNGSAVSTVNTGVDPFLNGAGQTTPSPLILNPGAHVLDIAFGGQTPMTLNLTDAKLGEDYEEQLYIFDYPVTYDGPLSISGSVTQCAQQAYQLWLEVLSSKDAGVPSDACLDMLAEVDVALRAALGIFPDVSITARNQAEANLVMAMQGKPPNAHRASDVVELPQDIQSIFENSPLSPGAFVGPDGVAYGSPYLGYVREMSTGDRQVMIEWGAVAATLEYLEGSQSNLSAALAADRRPDGEPGIIRQIFSVIGGLLVSPAEAAPMRPRGSRNGGLGRGRGFPRRGKGSNRRSRPTGRNGHVAHVQAHARRPVKSNTTVKFRTPGRPKFDRNLRIHIETGHGMNGTTSTGAHRYSSQIQQLRNSGRQFETRQVGPPNRADPNWRGYEYRVRRSDGTWSNWRVKTLYSDGVAYSRILGQGRQAFRNFITQNPGFTGGRWEGVTKGGLRIEGFAQMQGRFTFRISSFFAKRWW